MELQPLHLQNEYIQLVPLAVTDFEKLFAVASDPLLWEQHPMRNRYQREVFQTFFDYVISTGGAFLIYNAQTNELIGHSCYYNRNTETHTITIGYTFLARSHWGGKFNSSLKKLMLDYAFTFSECVRFEVAGINVRSQKAVEKIGAVKIAEEKIPHNDGAVHVGFIYEIKKGDWT